MLSIPGADVEEHFFRARLTPQGRIGDISKSHL